MRVSSSFDFGMHAVWTYLVRIDHEDISLVVTNDLPCNAQSLSILFNIGANFELEMRISLIHALAEQSLHVVMVRESQGAAWSEERRKSRAAHRTAAKSSSNRPEIVRNDESAKPAFAARA